MTNEPILCPKCNQQIVQVGKFWICPLDGPISLEKNNSRLCIFFSYGHDSNEKLVQLIKADLEKRGHHVWFDKSEIKSGQDWRRSITDGIEKSHRVLFFLSKHSTRDPGVCLDEIAIAIGIKGGNIQTILVEKEDEVKTPPSISYIQWLDMHDWKTQRNAGEETWEIWYQTKFSEIIAVMESDESRHFAGEIKTLEHFLKPISPDSRISQLVKKKLVGREWLFDKIDNWRSDRSSRLFWITGAPGVGKSAFTAHLAHYGKDKIIAVQFCEYDKPDHRNAQRVVRTLAFQIAARLPDYRKFLLTLPEITELDRKNPAELFDYLFTNPQKLSIDGGRERYLIVIDALDEAEENGRNELAEILAQNASRLPEWIGIVITSRPEADVTIPLQGLNPTILDTAIESNLDDIRSYLHHELAPYLESRPNADSLVEQILKQSEGVFLYAERFCDDVQKGCLSLDQPEQFPQGLGGIFFQYFQRQFPELNKFHEEVRPALRAILAAREPLPLEILKPCFNELEENLCNFTLKLGSLFPETNLHGDEVIKPYHKSLSDWLSDKTKAGPYFVSVHEGHKMLADWGQKELQSVPRKLHNYFAAHLLYHLEAVEQWEQIEATLLDEAFRKAKINVCSVGQLTDDYRGILVRWPVYRPNALRSITILAASLAKHLSENGRDELDIVMELIERQRYLQAARRAIRLDVPAAFVAAIGAQALIKGQALESCIAFELAWHKRDIDVCAVLGLIWGLAPALAKQVFDRLLAASPEAVDRIKLVNGVLQHGSLLVLRDVMDSCLAQALTWNDTILIYDIAQTTLPYVACDPTEEKIELLLDLVSLVSDARLSCNLLYEIGIITALGNYTPKESFATRFFEIAQRQIRVEEAVFVLPFAAYFIAMNCREAEALKLLQDLKSRVYTIHDSRVIGRTAYALNLVQAKSGGQILSLCDCIIVTLRKSDERDKAYLHLLRFCIDEETLSHKSRLDNLVEAIACTEAFRTEGEFLRFFELAGQLLTNISEEMRYSVFTDLMKLLQAWRAQIGLKVQAMCFLASSFPLNSNSRARLIEGSLESLQPNEIETVISNIRSINPSLGVEVARVAIMTLRSRLEKVTVCFESETLNVTVLEALARTVSNADMPRDLMEVVYQSVTAGLRSPGLEPQEVKGLISVAILLSCGSSNLQSVLKLVQYSYLLKNEKVLFMPMSWGSLLLNTIKTGQKQLSSNLRDRLLIPGIEDNISGLRLLRTWAWIAPRIPVEFKSNLTGLIRENEKNFSNQTVFRIAAASLVGELFSVGQAEEAKALALRIVGFLPRDGIEHLQVTRVILNSKYDPELLQMWHEVFMSDLPKMLPGAPSARVLVAACRVLAEIPGETKESQIQTLFLKSVQNYFSYPAGVAVAAALSHGAFGVTRRVTIEKHETTWTDHLALFSWECRNSKFGKETCTEMFSLGAVDLLNVGSADNSYALIELAIEALPNCSPASRGLDALREATEVITAHSTWKKVSNPFARAAVALAERTGDEHLLGMAAQIAILMCRLDLAELLLEKIRNPGIHQAQLSRCVPLAYRFCPETAVKWLNEIEGTEYARNAALDIIRDGTFSQGWEGHRVIVENTLGDLEAIDILIAGCIARIDWNEENSPIIANFLLDT